MAIPVNLKLPTVLVIGCGGTISSLAANPLDVMDYPEHGTKMSAEEVLCHFPETAQIANCIAQPFLQAGSSSFGMREWLELRELISRHAQREDISGIVVLHGTATMEETAYFLSLTLNISMPVVLVGSQRPANTTGSDAGANLVGAIRVATSQQARNAGVMVVMNDDIHCARDVVKASNYRVHAFTSPEYGPIGHVEGDGVLIRRRMAPEASAFCDWQPPTSLPRVDVLYSCAGNDGLLVEAACKAGAAGIVSIGLAPGLPSPLERAALERAIGNGVHVVQASRAYSGHVPLRAYLRDAGFIPAGDLSPQKSRILLTLALSLSTDVARLRQLFAIH